MPKSKVSFQSGETRTPITALQTVDLLAQSSGPQWLGLHLEVGSAEGWSGDDLMVNGHFLNMNMGPDPLSLKINDGSQTDWRTDTLQPGAFLIRPEGSYCSLQHQGHSKWAAAIIDGNVMDSVLEGHYRLKPGCNIANPILEHLFKALITQLLTEDAHPAITKCLVRSFIMTLGLHQGERVSESTPKTVMTQSQVHSLYAWIQDNMDNSFNVADMAEALQLPPVHFSRECKRITGRTAWELVVELRLERACQLLGKGETVCMTAMQCGFFDQAHLSRLFKQRYGVSPSAYSKTSAHTDE